MSKSLTKKKSRSSLRWKLSCRVGEITLCARRNSIVYPPRESNRDRLCGIIDTILAEQPKDFEVFLQKLIQQGYEVKRGKHTAAKGKRWLVLPGLGTLQPSEIAKFAVVLVFAHIIALNHDRMGSFAVGVLPFALVLGAVAVLMLLEPHLSGTVLILGIGAVLMFVGGTGLKWFVLAGAGGAAAIGAAIIIMPDLVPYAASRLSSWLDPFADPLGDGHQTIQSLYAIGSGGAAGLGLGSSRQKHLFVPEPQNDFIFSILCEELGFVGACAVILLFALLLWRGITLAAHAPDRFGALLVVGFVVQVALQAVLNMAVVTNTIPNTGISLPFFSSGGTSLMMLLGEMGIVLSVSRGET